MPPIPDEVLRRLAEKRAAAELERRLEARDAERERAAAETPLPAKAAHVRRAGQTRPHRCHGGMPGCAKQCPPAMWGCRSCWYKLPKRLRDRIWAAYRPGQEATLTPSLAYLEVAREVQAWIRFTYPDRETDHE
jgi:hypothetical protein